MAWFDTDEFSETYKQASFLFEGEDGLGHRWQRILHRLLSGRRCNVWCCRLVSRDAITKPLVKAEPWRDENRNSLAELSLGQWCLPILMSHAPMQALLDWGFEPQKTESKVFLVDGLADNITLPQFFIGQRKELRELGQGLFSGKIRQLLITGLGGQGKTSLAGKLARRLEQQGYLVHAYSARPSESNWDNFVFHLKSSLSELLEQVERRWALCANELQQAQLLLNALVQQGRLELLFDNLE